MPAVQHYVCRMWVSIFTSTLPYDAACSLPSPGQRGTACLLLLFAWETKSRGGTAPGAAVLACCACWRGREPATRGPRTGAKDGYFLAGVHIGKFTANSANFSSNLGKSNPPDCWVINVHTCMYIHVSEGINVHLNIHARPPPWKCPSPAWANAGFWCCRASQSGALLI